MPLLQERERQQIQEMLQGMTDPIRLVVFTQEVECQFCRETRQMAEEIAELSDLITTEVYNFIIDKEKAQEMGVDKIPAIVPIGKKDYGVRFYGIPSGYEFGAFIETLVDVSTGDPDLLPETKEALQKLNKPTHIQVFVTPT